MHYAATSYARVHRHAVPAPQWWCVIDGPPIPRRHRALLAGFRLPLPRVGGGPGVSWRTAPRRQREALSTFWRGSNRKTTRRRGRRARKLQRMLADIKRDGYATSDEDPAPGGRSEPLACR